MHFRNSLFLFFFFIFTNCSINNLNISKDKSFIQNNFQNKGFTLIFDENLFKEKIISKKINDRSLIIFQKRLKKNTQVKITNILNNKSLIVNVGNKANYPAFNNSVISLRIANELNIDINEPYVEITQISENSLFVANKAKTFDEEKKVAIKVPVNSISINDLNKIKIEKKVATDKKFSYIIKLADFYFKDTASLMVERITIENEIFNLKIKKILDKKYRVYLGPFNNINSLQNSYNDINILEFENIEIIRND